MFNQTISFQVCAAMYVFPNKIEYAGYPFNSNIRDKCVDANVDIETAEYVSEQRKTATEFVINQYTAEKAGITCSDILILTRS